MIAQRRRRSLERPSRRYPSCPAAAPSLAGAERDTIKFLEGSRAGMEDPVPGSGAAGSTGEERRRGGEQLREV